MKKIAFLQHKKSNLSNYLKCTLIPAAYLSVSSLAGNYMLLGLLYRKTAFFTSDSGDLLAFHQVPNPKAMECKSYLFSMKGTL